MSSASWEVIIPEQQTTARLAGTLVLWSVVSMAAALGLLAVQPVTGPDPSILSLVMLAPAVGAAVCWVVARRGLPRSPGPAPTRVFVRSLGLCALVIVVYFVVVAVVLGHPPTVPATVGGLPVVVMIGAQFLGSLGEEIGFRGLLLPGLMRWLPRPVAAVVVGILFGLWHVQYFGLPVLEHLAFILGTIALTVTMTYVMSGSFWQRMITCTIIHTGANLALAFAGGEQVSMTLFGGAIVIGGLIVVPLVLLLGRRRVSRTDQLASSGRSTIR